MRGADFSFRFVLKCASGMNTLKSVFARKMDMEKKYSVALVSPNLGDHMTVKLAHSLAKVSRVGEVFVAGVDRLSIPPTVGLRVFRLAFFLRGHSSCCRSFLK